MVGASGNKVIARSYRARVRCAVRRLIACMPYFYTCVTRRQGSISTFHAYPIRFSAWAFPWPSPTVVAGHVDTANTPRASLETRPLVRDIRAHRLCTFSNLLRVVDPIIIPRTN
jgi:hypothetical protein